jgi:hypothetical protein
MPGYFIAPRHIQLRNIRFQFGSPAGLLQEPYGFFFDLPDAFLGKVKIIANFLEVHRLSLSKPKAAAYYFRLLAG